MKQNETLKQYLTEIGWRYKGSCNCGGMGTLKFEINTPAGEFKLRVRALHFMLATPNTKFIKHPIAELKQTANAIAQIIERV